MGPAAVPESWFRRCLSVVEGAKGLDAVKLCVPWSSRSPVVVRIPKLVPTRFPEHPDRRTHIKWWQESVPARS